MTMMQSVPGAVATGSQFKGQSSLPSTNPVATAPGTDLTRPSGDCVLSELNAQKLINLWLGRSVNVADAAHRLDALYAVDRVAQLLAEVADVRIDASVER